MSSRHTIDTLRFWVSRITRQQRSCGRQIRRTQDTTRSGRIRSHISRTAYGGCGIQNTVATVFLFLYMNYNRIAQAHIRSSWLHSAEWRRYRADGRVRVYTDLMAVAGGSRTGAGYEFRRETWREKRKLGSRLVYAALQYTPAWWMSYNIYFQLPWWRGGR